jgi:hypothetical protein
LSTGTVKWQWDVGCETPPFTLANEHAVNLCLGLVGGTVQPDAAVRLSSAVAVQIADLLFPAFKAPRDKRLVEIGSAHSLYVRPARGEYSLTSNPHGVDKTIGAINNNDFGINSEHGEQRRATI